MTVAGARWKRDVGAERRQRGGEGRQRSTHHPVLHPPSTHHVDELVGQLLRGGRAQGDGRHRIVLGAAHRHAAPPRRKRLPQRQAGGGHRVQRRQHAGPRSAMAGGQAGVDGEAAGCEEQQAEAAQATAKRTAAAAGNAWLERRAQSAESGASCKTLATSGLISIRETGRREQGLSKPTCWARWGSSTLCDASAECTHRQEGREQSGECWWRPRPLCCAGVCVRERNRAQRARARMSRSIY